MPFLHQLHCKIMRNFPVNVKEPDPNVTFIVCLRLGNRGLKHFYKSKLLLQFTQFMFLYICNDKYSSIFIYEESYNYSMSTTLCNPLVCVYLFYKFWLCERLAWTLGQVWCHAYIVLSTTSNFLPPIMSILQMKIS